MLGHSGVGKTTYMASVYYALHDGPIFSRRNDCCGFGVIAQNDSAHKRLRALGKQIANGVYPKATDQRADYNFWLTFARPGFFGKSRENLMPFAWSDYRGGALQERTVNSDAATALREDLSQADAIIVFADANALQTRDADRTRREIKRLSAILIDAVTRRETAVPVVIAFTKADLARSSQTLDTELWQHFGSMIDVIDASEKMVGTYVCVACGANRMNVYAPLLFVLSWRICLNNHDLNSEIQYLEQHASEASRRSQQHSTEASGWGGLKGILNAGASVFTGEKSLWEKQEEERQRSVALLQNAKKRKLALEPLLAPAKAARAMCSGLPLIGKHPVLRN
jgi:GTPase SAR1 family protein